MITRKKPRLWFGFRLHPDSDDNKIDREEIYGCLRHAYHYNVFSVLLTLEYITEIEKISLFSVVLLTVLSLRIFFFIIETKNIISSDWR